MEKTLIVYGSTTGNTQYVAEVAERVLSQKGLSVSVVNAASAVAKDLCDGYDIILFGCSTWGDEDIELQDDFIPLFDQFSEIQAKGKKVAVFGCGDSSYQHFCGAVDLIEQTLEDQGAMVVDTLKIDGEPQSEKATIEEWVSGIVKVS